MDNPHRFTVMLIGEPEENELRLIRFYWAHEEEKPKFKFPFKRLERAFGKRSSALSKIIREKGGVMVPQDLNWNLVLGMM